MATSVTAQVPNAHAGAPPADDGGIDGIVMSLVLCTIPNPGPGPA